MFIREKTKTNKILYFHKRKQQKNKIHGFHKRKKGGVDIINELMFMSR